ncbi:ATP-binding protein [Neomegalonema sp.]|uniref:ATP-binding protein n=1 Tax=Neomegalonema sp. TaxID=2039713 RepID=UPI0026232273|nr:ATP-binding protein [Neomegalonema sp.]MDD2870343.1 ATP-binding protein [Neomegalonema sp.]
MKVGTGLRSFGEILRPDQAEPPILAPAVRGAVAGWMAEMRAEAELQAVGLKARRRAMLYGPPGTGKTTLAHHVAARLGLPMLRVRADRLTGQYMGQATQAVAQLFDLIEEEEKPLVLFFDEMEGIGSKRESFSRGGADNERMLQMGVLLQRVERHEGILIGATNKKEMLDDALWRRFDLQILIGQPGEDERFAILRRYLAPYAPSDEAVFAMSKALDGASPALLRGFSESLKRISILGPRMGRAQSFAEILASLAVSVQPHPSYDPPPLWGDRGARERLAEAFPWPMARPEAPEGDAEGGHERP